MASETLIAGKYKLLGLIGSGSWGDVYKAENVHLDKPIAIKILHSHLLSNPDNKERFLREAQAASRVKHPGICPVFDYGTNEDGRPYFVMEYIAGQSLAAMVKERKRLPAQEAVSLAAKVAAALAAAHKEGIIHRDLTPGNILLNCDGQPIILDFGLAKFTLQPGEGESLTASGTTLGTPAYMSPEQCMGHKLDTRSDIYSLGCVLHEMLFGDPPFEGATILATMHLHATKPLPPLDQTVNVPAHIKRALLRSLSKNPEDRQQTALEFADELTRGRKLPTISRKMKRRILIATVSVALIASCAVASFFIWKTMPPKAAKQPSQTDQAAAIAIQKQADSLYGRLRDDFDSNRFGDARSCIARLVPLAADKRIPPEKAAQMLIACGNACKVIADDATGSTAFRLAIKRLKQYCKPASSRVVYQQLSLIDNLILQGLAVSMQNIYWCYPDPWVEADNVIKEMGDELRGQPGMEREELIVKAEAACLLNAKKRYKASAEAFLAIMPQLDKDATFNYESASNYQVAAESLAFLGRMDESNALYQRALEREETTGASKAWQLSKHYIALGNLYTRLGDCKTARAYFDKAQQLQRRRPDTDPIQSQLNGYAALSKLQAADPTDGYKFYDAEIRRAWAATPPSIRHVIASPMENPPDPHPPHSYAAPATFDPKTIKQIPDLANLNTLSLTGTLVTDDDIANLGHRDNLQCLYLAGTNITDGVAAHLAQFPNLQKLDVSATPIGSRTAKALAKLKDFQRLYAGATQLKDGDMSTLATSATLKKLCLTATAVTDRGLQNLSRSRSLEDLDLHGVNAITDKGIAVFRNTPSLATLTLMETRVQGSGLRGLTQLQRLYFCNPHADPDISAIANMPHLRVLMVANTPTTDAMVASLPKLTELEVLNLACTDVTDATVKLLPGLPHLKKLSLNHTAITDAAIEYIAQCSNLEVLHLSQDRIHDVKALVGLKGLKSISFYQDPIPEENLAAFHTRAFSKVAR